MWQKSLYLRDTEGLNGPTNAEVLSSLVAFVRTLPEPWIILGDWNLDPTEVQDTALIQVMRATVAILECCGQTQGGGPPNAESQGAADTVQGLAPSGISERDATSLQLSQEE